MTISQTKLEREVLAAKNSLPLQANYKDFDNVPRPVHEPPKGGDIFSGKSTTNPNDMTVSKSSVSRTIPRKKFNFNTHSSIPAVSITEPPVSSTGPSRLKKRTLSASLATNKRPSKSKLGPEHATGDSRNKSRAASTGSLPIPRDLGLEDCDQELITTPAGASVKIRRPSETTPACCDGAATGTFESLLQRQRSPSSTPSFDSISSSDDFLGAFETPNADGKFFMDTPKSNKKNATPSNIDDAIQKYIETQLTQTRIEELREGSKGRLYINKNHQNLAGRVYKIGKTETPTNKRRGNQEVKCGDSLEECGFSDRVLILHSAEHLCHLQLQFFYQPYIHPAGSKCSIKHREYYEVKLETAKTIVDMWAAFCEHVPYDLDGILKPFWAHRLSSMEKFPTYQTHHDLDAQISRWRSFIHLSCLDRIWHDKSEAWCHLFRLKHDTYFWEWTAFLLALIGAVEGFLGQVFSLWFRIPIPLTFALVYFCYTLSPKLKTSFMGAALLTRIGMAPVSFWTSLASFRTASVELEKVASKPLLQEALIDI